MTDFVVALAEAKKRFMAHPWWRRLEGTPWENDAPVIAAELARDESAKLRALLDRLCATADHVMHYAYGRTPDEQLGEVAFNIVREYRASAQAHGLKAALVPPGSSGE